MPEISIQQALDLAFKYHEAGKLREAEQLYRGILARQPDHFEAVHNLGLIAHQVGRNDAAVDLVRRAIAMRPDYAEAHANLGTILAEMGRTDEAVASFRRAIALKPQLAEAHSSLGNMLREKRQWEQSESHCREAIRLKPTLASAHSNLGNALRGMERREEAIVSYRQAIALDPRLADAHSNLGNALRETGHHAEAVAACRQAIALRPNHVNAHCNLGNALTDLHQIDEAIAAYRKAISLNPGFAEGYSNLSVALKLTDNLDQAAAILEKAIELKPDYPQVHCNLGVVKKEMGRIDEAVAEFRRAVELNPDYLQAHSNLILAMHYDPRCTPQTIRDECIRWNQKFAQPVAKPIAPFEKIADPDRRLRVGYLTADFKSHASAYFLWPLYREHDRGRFEIFSYAQVICPDETTQKFQQHSDAWRNISQLSDEQAAEQIRRDQIDILVDLKLHTAEHRLLVFARKPAPVQVSWLGYPGGPGLDAIEYRLSDPYLEAPGAESPYSEKVVRLSETFWCYDPFDESDISVKPLPAQTNGFITFGCLNNFCKANDNLFSVWAQVMRQTENSRLLLLAAEGSLRKRTLEYFEAQGIDRSRIEFLSRRSRREYLEAYHRIDLGLDTFPYNGHTTTLDSLWMGVPVATLIGKTPVGRAGWSQLSNLGLPELAGESEEQFVRIAVGLAKDLPRLADLRAGLRDRMQRSPLMDAPKFARGMEAAFRRMWRTWCQPQSPENPT
jgi:protein O-GlcNAc transferase